MPSRPAASLLALEQHLEVRLLELDRLHHSRPLLPTAIARAPASRQIGDLLEEIGELQSQIDASPALTLQNATVKLRWLGAYIDQ